MPLYNIALQGYVKSLRVLKNGLSKTPLLDILDKKAAQSKGWHLVRSQLALHNLEDMVNLDVPWWTYPAIEYIEQLLASKQLNSVFEYGSGASTLWLAKRNLQVCSVEHQLQWYTALRSLTDAYANIRLKYVPARLQMHMTSGIHSARQPGYDFTDYVNAIRAEVEQFDMIVIDGRCRSDCLLEAIGRLNPGGLIVFDNSNRRRYKPVLDRFANNLLRFKGWVPGAFFKSETAIIQFRE